MPNLCHCFLFARQHLLESFAVLLVIGTELSPFFLLSPGQHWLPIPVLNGLPTDSIFYVTTPFPGSTSCADWDSDKRFREIS